MNAGLIIGLILLVLLSAFDIAVIKYMATENIAAPDPDLREAFKWLKDNSPPTSYYYTPDKPAEYGIDLKRIEGIPQSPDACDIIFVGRLIKEKNVDVLLEALGYVIDMQYYVKCHIIGDGPEKGKLVELAARRKLLDNVRFFRFMDYEEVIARVKSSKILVLPSKREGFGMVILEAFACGVPVITVKGERNAAASLVDEKTGLVVNLNAGELGRAISTLIKDAAPRKKMSLAAVNKAQAYDWDKIVRQLAYLYKELNYE